MGSPGNGLSLAVRYGGGFGDFDLTLLRVIRLSNRLFLEPLSESSLEMEPEVDDEGECDGAGQEFTMVT